MAVTLAREGGRAGLVRAVGDVGPRCEEDVIGAGGANVGLGRWVERLLLRQDDHGGCGGGGSEGGWVHGEPASARSSRSTTLLFIQCPGVGNLHPIGLCYLRTFPGRPRLLAQTIRPIASVM
jgi:hypothetical protein